MADQKTPAEVVAIQIEQKAAARGIDLRDRESVKEKEAMMATCAKGCGKEFSSEAWKTKHEAKCDGTPAVPKPAPKKREKRWTPPAEEHAGNGMMDDVITHLKKKREQRIQDLVGDDPDIKALDIAIDALENRPT